MSAQASSALQAGGGSLGEAVGARYAVSDAVNRLKLAAMLQKIFELKRQESEAAPSHIGDGDAKALEISFPKQMI